MAEYTEHLLDVNVFHKPKVLTDKNAVSILLVRLIMLEPGTDQIRPEMGVGLVSKFRYIDEDNLYELSSEIQRQINIFLPEFQTVDVNLNYDAVQKVIYIAINVDDLFFEYTATVDENNKITISDLTNNN